MESTQENCYPGSTVLVNKFGLTDQNTLDIVERQIVLLKGAEIERNAVFENVILGDMTADFFYCTILSTLFPKIRNLLRCHFLLLFKTLFL